MPDDIPLILLPGLGADGRMFSSLQIGLPQLITPPWIKPVRGESVAEYARRFAPIIDPGGPCFIGGASFGGVVAQELAAILPNVRACFVIGSLRSGDAKPWRIRVLRPITPLVSILPWISPLLVRVIGTLLRPPTRGVLIQLADADRSVLRWGAGAVLSWRPSPEIQRVRILQIHGDRDRVFPIRLTHPDCIVSGAGHLIAITHAKQVLEFLKTQMQALPRRHGGR